MFRGTCGARLKIESLPSYQLLRLQLILTFLIFQVTACSILNTHNRCPGPVGPRPCRPRPKAAARVVHDRPHPPKMRVPLVLLLKDAWGTLSFDAIGHGRPWRALPCPTARRQLIVAFFSADVTPCTPTASNPRVLLLLTDRNALEAIQAG